LVHGAATESEQQPRHRRGAVGGGHNLPDVTSPRHWEPRFLEEEGAKADHHLQHVMPMMMERAAMAADSAPPVAPGELEIRASVTLVAEIR
jgi:hypothetical protein